MRKSNSANSSPIETGVPPTLDLHDQWAVPPEMEGMAVSRQWLFLLPISHSGLKVWHNLLTRLTPVTFFFTSFELISFLFLLLARINLFSSYSCVCLVMKPSLPSASSFWEGGSKHKYIKYLKISLCLMSRFCVANSGWLCRPEPFLHLRDPWLYMRTAANSPLTWKFPRLFKGFWQHQNPHS